MAKNLNVSNPYLNQPCERCGSKKRIAKSWKETFPTLTGTAIVERAQIVCTNDVCQIAFDKHLLEETRKKEILRLKKEANEAARKTHALLKSRKNNSKI